MPGPLYASHNFDIGVGSTKYLLWSGNTPPEDVLVSSQRSNRFEAIHSLPIPAEKALLWKSFRGEKVYGQSRRGDHPKVCETPGMPWAFSKRDR